MTGSDDPRLGPVEAGHGLFALAAILAGGGVGYLRDLDAAVRQLFGRGGLEAALREETSRAQADLLALAVVADGVITEAERGAVEAYARRQELDPAEVLAGIDALADALRDPAVLRARVTARAAPLDADGRLEVFVAVKNLAHRGSRAWPEAVGYRDGAPTPEDLIAAFRDALGIRGA